MPYGVDKKLGGDSPANVKFMESCVAKIHGTNPRTKKPYTKGEKVAICKAALRKKHAKAEADKYLEYIIDRGLLQRLLAG